MSQTIISAMFRQAVGAATLEVADNSDFGNPIIYGPAQLAAGCAKFTVPHAGLAPATEYFYRVVSDGWIGSDIGTFRTRPQSNSFSFAFGGDCASQSDSVVFDHIRALNPVFFICPGDLHYDDNGLKSGADINAAIHAESYERVLASPRRASFMRDIPTWYVPDDHDFSKDDVDGTDLPIRKACDAYRQRVPVETELSGATDPIYWRRDVGRCIFLGTDLRSARSPKTQADDANKTMMGATQKAWFKDQLALNPGKYFVWISSVSWLQPATAGADQWGGYSTERRELADWIKQHCAGRIAVLSADYHCLAFDSGANADYATGGGAPVPVFVAAPLDKDVSAPAGGTWDIGVSSLNNQFAHVAVADTGGPSINITVTGYRGNEAGLVQMTQHSFQAAL